MHNRWDTLTFLHWSYDPEVVQRLLPPGLRVETYDGRAWVGLVPFFMQVRATGTTWIPWAGKFCETNVRTYVHGPDGSTGVWFLSLEAARLTVVGFGRGGYGVPYFWARMRRERGEDASRGVEWRYTSRRRWPSPKGASSDIRVRVGDPRATNELAEFDHWLTARFRLYGARRSGALVTAEADHEVWPLFRCEVLRCEQTLIEAAGLPTPIGAPIAHWSPRVTVRVARPRRL
jgi:uncharacterized protein YqjF (DUF2071 family)